MRPYSLFISLLFIIIQLSCNKDDNNPAVTKLLDYTTSSKTASPWVYTYNTEGQLTGYENNDYKASLDANGNQLHFLLFYYPENRALIDGVYALNADGNIASGHVVSTYDINAPYSSDFIYEYGPDGKIAKRTEAQSNGTYYTADFFWNNGDLTSIIWKQNGNPYVTEFLEYDTSTPDKLHISQDLFYMPMNDFVGSLNQHLQKRSYTIVPPDNTQTNIYNYTFKLDGDGFPTTLNLDKTDDSYHELISYYYQ